MRVIRRTAALLMTLAVLLSACAPAAAAKKNRDYQVNDKNKAVFIELLNRLKTAYEAPAEDDSEQIDTLVEKIAFSDKGDKEMKNLVAAITEILNITFQSFLNDDADTAARVEPLEQVIDRICLKMKERHAARLQKGKCTIGHGYVFNDLIADFERVSDHCSNIGIVIVDLISNSLDVHELSDEMHTDRPDRYQEYFEEFQGKYLKKKDWETAEEMA